MHALLLIAWKPAAHHVQRRPSELLMPWHPRTGFHADALHYASAVDSTRGNGGRTTTGTAT